MRYASNLKFRHKLFFILDPSQIIRKAHKLNFIVVFLGILSFGVGLPFTTYSAGIPVIDASNLAQTSIAASEAVNQTLKQLEKYALQLQQFEDQLKNSVAPAAYVWSQAEKTMNKILALQDQLDSYMSLGGGDLDAYLSKFGNVNTYRNSPYFAAPSANEAELERQRKEVMRAEELGSEARKKTNDNVVRTLEQQQQALRDDAATLEQLQTSAQSAQGRLEAIQYANQLAAHQSGQLLQLRAMLMAQIAADNAREQALAAREARQQAKSEKALESRYKKSSGRIWNPF